LPFLFIFFLGFLPFLLPPLPQTTPQPTSPLFFISPPPFSVQQRYGEPLRFSLHFDHLLFFFLFFCDSGLETVLSLFLDLGTVCGSRSFFQPLAFCSVRNGFVTLPFGLRLLVVREFWFFFPCVHEFRFLCLFTFPPSCYLFRFPFTFSFFFQFGDPPVELSLCPPLSSVLSALSWPFVRFSLAKYLLTVFLPVPLSSPCAGPDRRVLPRLPPTFLFVGATLFFLCFLPLCCHPPYPPGIAICPTVLTSVCCP